MPRCCLLPIRLAARARLHSMQALERQLEALRARCAERHPAGECGILHELVAAAHGEACACHAERDAGNEPVPPVA